MLGVREYVKLIQQKKHLSNVDLCKRINKIEEQLGDRRTTPTNITNFFSGDRGIGYMFAAKLEVALGLPTNTLISMISEPANKDEMKKFMQKIKNIKI